MSAAVPALLELRGISKRFGHVVALERVASDVAICIWFWRVLVYGYRHGNWRAIVEMVDELAPAGRKFRQGGPHFGGGGVLNVPHVGQRNLK